MNAEPAKTLTNAEMLGTVFGRTAGGSTGGVYEG